MQAQIRHLAAAGVHGNCHLAHFAAGDFPGQAQAVGKAILHPIGAEFCRQEQIECSGFGINLAQLDRFDPLAVKLVPQIFAQTLANIGPVRCQVYRFQILHLTINLSLAREFT